MNWPAWSRWLVTLSFLTLVNWMLLAPAGIFRRIHLVLAHQDKVAHALIFLTLAMLVRWSLPEAWEKGRLRVALVVALVLYASSVELLQPLVAGSGRLFEWLDMASNFVGLGVGWALFGKVAITPGELASTDH